MLHFFLIIYNRGIQKRHSMKQHSYALQGMRMKASEAIFLWAIKPDMAYSTFLAFCISAGSSVDIWKRKWAVKEYSWYSEWLFWGRCCSSQGIQFPAVKEREHRGVVVPTTLSAVLCQPSKEYMDLKIGIWDSSLPWKINLSEVNRVCLVLNSESPIKSKYKYFKLTETSSRFPVS